jgi:hypothetical protein
MINVLALALLAADPAAPVIERLDPPRRAAVVMALLGLVLTGLLLVACAMLGANWVRRMARHHPESRDFAGDNQAHARNRRLRDSLHSILSNTRSDETIHGDSTSGETKVD